MKLSVKLFFLLVCCSALPSYAAVRLPQVISDGMVLQRNVPLKIWGWADAGEKITFDFKGKKYYTQASQTGNWLLMLPAQKPGGPFTLTISATNTITIKDVLIGDVWFCSGQSNMVLPMERVKEKYPDEIVQADNPQIRNFFLATQSDVTEEHGDILPAKWNSATPLNVLRFGAATWFFASQLYKKYHVPIGIINSSVGGTPIKAWISKGGLKALAPYNNRIVQINTAAFQDSLLHQSLPQKSTVPAGQNDKGLLEETKWYDEAYKPDDWHNFWLPGYWADQGIKGLNGVVWFRKEIILSDSMAGMPAKLFLGRIVDADDTYVNGKLVGRITYQYPPRRYEVPAGLLKAGKNSIVVRLINTSGKGGFVPGKTYEIKIGNTTIDLRGDWQYKVGEAFTPDQFKDPFPVFSAQNEPAGLYNTMVAPLVNYPVKGLLWYQGETDVNTASGYGQLLKALITDWRSKWNDTQLPFIFAQLANLNEVEYLPSESQWADLRQEQLSALSVPNTRMTVNIDLGEWNDIHPLNKKEVGERLAFAAENLAYGESAVVPSGPIVQSTTALGDKVQLTFSSTGSGLVVKGDQQLSGFAVAGADKKYIWARASIQGNKVILYSDKIAQPMYVRYAWADNPEGANLYNKEGLPASPFQVNVLPQK